MRGRTIHTAVDNMYLYRAVCRISGQMYWQLQVTLQMAREMSENISIVAWTAIGSRNLSTQSLFKKEASYETSP